MRRFAHGEAFRDSVGAFCDAIFIAAFLAYAVDPVVKQALLKEGIKNIFRYIYGYNLPPDLQTFYDETIVPAQILRRNNQLHWSMGRPHNTSDRAALRLHASFDIANFTNKDLIYTHKVYATSDAPGDKGSVECLYCRNLESGEFEYEYQRNQLEAMKPAGGPHRDSRAGDEISFPAKSIDHAPRYCFGVHYYSEQALAFGIDEFRISELTAHIEVIVSVDEQFKEHRFSIVPQQPGQGEDLKPTFDTQYRDYRCVWRFNRLFVPNETIVIRWRAATQEPVTKPLDASLHRPSAPASPSTAYNAGSSKDAHAPASPGSL